MHGGDIYRNDIELDFSVNINPFGAPESVKKALMLAAGKIENYPDINCEKLRKALAVKLGVKEDLIIFGNGASELFNAITFALRPEKVLIAEPAFSGYRRAALAAGSDVISYRLPEENDFALDEGILSEINDETDLVFIADPNNPNGKTAYRELVEKILKRALEKKAAVVLDECFITLSGRAADDSFIKRTDEFPNLCVVRSFTKTYAIPGVRLGYMLSSDEELRKKIQLGLGEWNVSVLAQEAGLAALDEDDYLEKSIEYIKKERNCLIEELGKIGYNCIDSDADFIMFKGEKGLDRKLLASKILIRNCSDYEGLGEGWYRIAVKKHDDNLKLINAIRGQGR